MKEADYATLAVGEFVQKQTSLAKYASANEKELGGTDAVIQLLFHAQVISACIVVERGQTIPTISFQQLDAVVSSPGSLEETEPALQEYIETNVEGDAIKAMLCTFAMAMTTAG